MLTVSKQHTVTATQTLSLDEAGGTVVLSLSDGEGHVFRQALSAHDTGKLLALLAIGGHDDAKLCQGDLVAEIVADDRDALHLVWHDEKGGDGLVRIDLPSELVLEEALRSYCRLLLKGIPQ